MDLGVMTQLPLGILSECSDSFSQLLQSDVDICGST